MCACLSRRTLHCRFHNPRQPRSIHRKALNLPFNERSVGFASLQSLWAFNFGHPCPPSKKGEVLLLGQAEPTMVGIEIDSTTIFKTSEQSQSPPSRLRNVTEILKSDFLNCAPTNDKLVFAVPPPLFRGEARVIVLRNNFCTIAKPRPFRYPSKIRNVIKGRNCQRHRRLRVVRLSCR